MRYRIWAADIIPLSEIRSTAETLEGPHSVLLSFLSPSARCGAQGFDDWIPDDRSIRGPEHSLAQGIPHSVFVNVMPTRVTTATLCDFDIPDGHVRHVQNNRWLVVRYRYIGSGVCSWNVERLIRTVAALDPDDPGDLATLYSWPGVSTSGP